MRRAEVCHETGPRQGCLHRANVCDHVCMDLRAELRLKFDEVCAELDATPPPQLLHYTSPGGFKGIVESASLWCTDIRNVNDSSEGDHGMSVLKGVLHTKSVPRKFSDAVYACNDLFGLKRLYTSYVTSFSSGSEEPYMWNNYAAKGTGCAVVFDYAALDRGADGGREYSLVRMVYDSAQQSCMMRRLVDHAIQVQRRSSLSSHSAAQFWNEEVAFSLMNCGMLFKNVKWCREREFRLVVMGGGNETALRLGGYPRVVRRLDPGAVVGVVRGPDCGDGLRAECIRALLRKCGYPDGVPIRDTPPY